MSDKFVVPLKPVNHFSRLPNQTLVSQFIKTIKQVLQQAEPRCCFVAAQSKLDAFLIVCFCFGKLALIEQLSKNKQISQETIKCFQQSLQTYEWNKTAFQIFQTNAEKFGKTYPKYFQQILSNYKSQNGQEEVQQMFKKIIQNDLLYNVKIRIWDENKQDGNHYKRKHEESQFYHSCNLVYLLITIDKDNNAYNVGMVEMKKKVDVRDTLMTITNQQQAHQPQEELIQDNKKQIENYMDLNKRPMTQQKASKQKVCMGCQII